MRFIRLVDHGSGNYEQMRKDPTGADIGKCNPGCAKGYAFYVSSSDHIPRDPGVAVQCASKLGHAAVGAAQEVLRVRHAPVESGRERADSHCL